MSTSRAVAAIAIYLLAMPVGAAFFWAGHHQIAFAIIVGVWLCLVVWLKVRI